MPVSTATGFSVIDTYNTIREDMQTSDYEEFDTLDDQQGVPQFSFSSSTSSSSTPPSFTFPTAAEQTTTGHGVVPQQVNNSRYSSPSPCFSSPSPSPSPCPLPPSRSQGQSLADVTDQQLQSLLNGDMDVSAGFLEDLIWPSPSVPVPVPVQPSPALSPSPLTTTTTTTTTRTNYVAEAAAAGCTVVQTNADVRDQQLGDMDMADLYDLDRHHSFYDDTAALDSKVKDARPYADWTVVGDLELSPTGESPLQQLSPVGPSLTELGPVAGNEQEDLLSAFDSLRRDILLDCKQLNISPNPKTWSAEDSRSWTTYMLDKAQRSDDCSASLALAGPLLCQKSRDELLWASPSSGDFLHDQLQLWIALADLPALPSSKPPQQQQQNHQHQSPLLTLPPVADFQLTPPQSGATLSHLPPSVSPAPSTDSACSSQSSSSSSSSLSSFSDAEMTFWGQENPGEELFLDSVANLTPADHPQPTVPSTLSTSTSSKHGAGRPGKQIRLWEFLKELLQDNDPAIKWLDRARGIFKIEDSNRVARLWGSRKNHPAMNYDKLSRSVRQYYKKGIIKKTAQTRRLVYQFCERYL